MPRAAKGTKTLVCQACHQEKLYHLNFTHGAITCKACVDGVDRVCGGCRAHKPAAAFQDGTRRHCRDCNAGKDTAEHVDACEACGAAFRRNPDTFVWKKRGAGGNWPVKCRGCMAFKGYDEPRQCTDCGETKEPAAFNKPGICIPCRSAHSTRERAAKAATVTRDTAFRPAHCTNQACRKPFSADEFRFKGDRWSSQCASCIDAHRYWEAYRERRLAEDPEGFCKRRYETHRAYMALHPEKQHAYNLRRRTCLGQSWGAFKTQMGRAWPPKTFDHDQEQELMDLFLLPCAYCGYEPPAGTALNTLDRVDNACRLYRLSNVVTCCTPCNRLKGSSTYDAFCEKAFAEARKGEFDGSCSRLEISDAYRSCSSHDAAARAASACRYHQQMCFVAQHLGFEF